VEFRLLFSIQLFELRSLNHYSYKSLKNILCSDVIVPGKWEGEGRCQCWPSVGVSWTYEIVL